MTDLPEAVVFDSPDEEATFRLGETLGRALREPLTIALVGDLGAGKTRFVRGLAAGLDVDPHEVSSPTFVLIHEYGGRIPLFHLDTYRLRTATEFADLGVAELFAGPAVVAVEWADRFPSLLPADRLEIGVEIAGEGARRFRATAHGPAARRVLAAWRSAV